MLWATGGGSQQWVRGWVARGYNTRVMKWARGGGIVAQTRHCARDPRPRPARCRVRAADLELTEHRKSTLVSNLTRSD